MVNVILATLIANNKPSDVQFILVDLKGGMEFDSYRDIPHLMQIPQVCESGIITDRDHVPPVLTWLIKHGEERMNIIREAGHKNIGLYNTYRRTTRMSRIILVIDEWADVRLDRQVGRWAEDALTNIAQRMRAVGIHVILATQTPKKEVISTLIKSNMPGRMAFSCTDHTSSILIVDSIAARGLEPQGRFVFQKGAQTITVQAPFIGERQLEQIIQGAKDGKSYQDMSHQEKHDVSIQEILRWAWNENGGRLPVAMVYNHFRERGLGKTETEESLKSIENTEIELDGELYLVEPGTNRKARQMKLIT
jgi:S-DNA-T family DNA segregation ATPase FtsK/SpoIIIE